MPKGKALKVQFHDENGVLDGPPQTVALQQDLEDLKIELRKEFLGLCFVFLKPNVYFFIASCPRDG